MPPLVLISPVILTFIIFLVPEKIREIYARLLTLFIAVVTAIPAVQGFAETTVIIAGFQNFSLTFTIDKLSAFFILVADFTAVTGIMVSGGILRGYKKSPVQYALHYFSYSWLHLSMLALLMLREGLPFLIAWELMAVSSFMLILFDAEKRTILKTAVNYLVQMHIGLVLLVIAFLIVWKDTGTMGFDSLKPYFSQYPGTGLFLLFFFGFSMKAGFIPFHTWLPEAHPAAPSHVSGFMSGVMIKMGIYGIFRVLVCMHQDLYRLGLAVLIISAVSALLGIMLSIVQKDLKRLLAYCSIENIGIIGMGIGTGMMGAGGRNDLMMILGLTGAFLHIINHSLVKSLLFFSTGSLYMRYHTRDIEELGGVIKKMPHTSVMFLWGSIAICGLPPMSTFVSELLIFSGMFSGLSAGSPFQSVAMLGGIIALAVTGGLAIFAFAKAFGITFLGNPRKNFEGIREAGPSMIITQYVIAGILILAGLFPVVMLKPLTELVLFYFPAASANALFSLADVLSGISLTGGILILIIILILALRKIVSRNMIIDEGPTWGCGYTEGSQKMQYTGTSFSANLGGLASPLIPEEKIFEAVEKSEIFPSARKFTSAPVDFFRKTIYRLTDSSMWMLKYLARLQTGHIQHYILYAFIFILLIFFLLYLKLI